MQYKPIITNRTIIFHLQKPIYESHYGIWDKWLKIAKDKNLNIVVNTKFGTSTYTFSSYMNGAVLKKRFYKNPDEPMRFWCRDFLPDITKRTERKKIEKKIDMSTNVVMTVMARLKKDKPELFNKIRAEVSSL